MSSWDELIVVSIKKGASSSFNLGTVSFPLLNVQFMNTIHEAATLSATAS